MTFTDEQAYHVYQALVGAGDSKLISQLAKAAIRNAAEIQTDLANDSDIDVPLPNNDDVRNFAVSFTTDYFTPVTAQLIAEIQRCQFNAQIEETRTVKHSLVFPG